METERLLLMPLPLSELELWERDLPALEKALCCSCQAEPMEGEFRDIVREQIAIVRQYPDDYRWHSFWLLIRKSDRVVVGSADFKRAPDEHGEVEIGYGLGNAFERQGYMTEAVRAMCEWALRQDGVLHVIAETERDSFASQRILSRCGFTQYRADKTLWFRL